MNPVFYIFSRPYLNHAASVKLQKNWTCITHKSQETQTTGTVKMINSSSQNKTSKTSFYREVSASKKPGKNNLWDKAVVLFWLLCDPAVFPYCCLAKVQLACIIHLTVTEPNKTDEHKSERFLKLGNIHFDKKDEVCLKDKTEFDQLKEETSEKVDHLFLMSNFQLVF